MYFQQIVIYLRMCLAQCAGCQPTPVFSEMQEQAPRVAVYVRQLLSQYPLDTGPIAWYIDMLRQLLTAISGKVIASISTCKVCMPMHTQHMYSSMVTKFCLLPSHLLRGIGPFFCTLFTAVHLWSTEMQIFSKVEVFATDQQLDFMLFLILFTWELSNVL